MLPVWIYARAANAKRVFGCSVREEWTEYVRSKLKESNIEVPDAFCNMPGPERAHHVSAWCEACKHAEGHVVGFALLKLVVVTDELAVLDRDRVEIADYWVASVGSSRPLYFSSSLMPFF